MPSDLPQMAPNLKHLAQFIFYFSFALAGLGWGALFLFPRRAWANFWLAGIYVPLVLGIIYTFMMILYWFQPPYPGNLIDFLLPEGLSNLFRNHGLRTAGFIDLLAFPLIAGAWMARRAAQIRMPYIYLAICMLLTITVPGTGFVAFILVVAIKGRVRDLAGFEGVPPAESLEVAARPW
jgi:hypothetical protein